MMPDERAAAYEHMWLEPAGCAQNGCRADDRSLTYYGRRTDVRQRMDDGRASPSILGQQRRLADAITAHPDDYAGAACAVVVDCHHVEVVDPAADPSRFDELDEACHSVPGRMCVLDDLEGERAGAGDVDLSGVVGHRLSDDTQARRASYPLRIASP